MNAIVGLVERKDSLDNALLELRQAGCSAQRTRLPAPPTTVSEQVASSRRRSSPRATAVDGKLIDQPQRLH
jgi:hypothetical protein